MKIVVRKSAVLGAGTGLVGCAALYLLVDRHIVNDDKALDVVTAAVLVLANAIGFRVAERFGVRLSGAAVAALGGMAVGSWVGFHTIGSFEQRVPIDSRPNGAPAIEGEEGADELKNPPREKVERTPVGGEAGVLIGWAGCFTLYLWLSRTTRSRRVRVAVGGLATVLVVGLLATVYIRQPATLRGHTDNVWCIAFSPDGTLMASGGWDNTVRLWNPTDRKLVATLTGHTGCVWAVAFSPDGKTLASAGYDKTVKLWDPRTGRETATLPDAPDNWASLAFSPDGKRLAIPTRYGQVALWDLMAAQKTATVIGPPLVDWGEERKRPRSAPMARRWPWVPGRPTFEISGPTRTRTGNRAPDTTTA